MASDDDSPAPEGGGAEEEASFAGAEGGAEGGEERSTPRKNLAAATFIAVFSIFAMDLAWRLPVPDSIFTAPGLLPFLTGLSLLAMALGLGVKAVRQGGARGFFEGSGAIVRGYFDNEENRRTLLLIGIIFLWVMVIGQVTFDLRFPTPVHVFRFSSYEAISIPMLAWVLRIFWRASVGRCFVVSVVIVVALGTVFRDGFKILLPEAG